MSVYFSGLEQDSLVMNGTTEITVPNLIIDQGNTSAKVAVFEADRLLLEETHGQLQVDRLRELCQSYSIRNAIISNVNKPSVELHAFFETYMDTWICLDHQTPLPIKNLYSTPETLGPDRLAAVVGADNIKPNASLLVIDSGTAVTYDFIDKGIYHGGNIAPGLRMRFRALHEFTSRLPLCGHEGEIPLLGTDTKTAIQSGVVNGMLFEMEGVIEHLKESYPDLYIFLTGGDAFFFESRLKSANFVDYFLVMKGLNRILNYNVK